MKKKDRQESKVRICSLKLVTPNGVRIECGSLQEAINFLQKLEYHFGAKYQLSSIHKSSRSSSKNTLATLAELEAAAIRHALLTEDSNKTRAAKILGISRDALMRKMRRHGIDVQKSVA